jgi:hypothetical protein
MRIAKAKAAALTTEAQKFAADVDNWARDLKQSRRDLERHWAAVTATDASPAVSWAALSQVISMKKRCFRLLILLTPTLE